MIVIAVILHENHDKLGITEFSLDLFGCLELFETSGNIFPQVLKLTLIVLTEVKSGHKSLLKVQQIIVVLPANIPFDWTDFVIVYRYARFFRLLFLEPPKNVISCFSQSHIQTFFLLLLDDWNFLNALADYRLDSGGNFTFVVEKFLIIQPTKLCFGYNCGQKIDHAFLLVEYRWLGLLYFFILDFSLLPYFLDLLIEFLYLFLVFISGVVSYLS